MKLLASYIMRGPLQAVLLAAASALFALVLPPVSYLSGATVGLVTLRAGVRQGALVAFGAAGLTALVTLPLHGTALPSLAFGLGVWLPVLTLASSLRRSVSLSRSILLAGLFGAMVVLGFHLMVDDLGAWWRSLLDEVLAQAVPADDPNAPQLNALLDDAVRLMTGVMAATVSLGMLVSLFIARWWQALLYNPGGFGGEFRQLRLGQGPALATLLLLGLSLGLGGRLPLLSDLLLVAAVLHMLQGLAVVHGLVALRKANPGWVIGLYVLLVIAMPQTVLSLAVAGLADNWFDFRARFAGAGKGD